MVTLDCRDLAKYPFLKESQAYISAATSSFDIFISSPLGNLAVHEALNIVESALKHSSQKVPKLPEIPSESSAVTVIIAAYPVSRILVSCTHDRSMIEKLVRYQSRLISLFLQDERPDTKRYIKRSIGLPITGTTIPVTQYIRISARIPEDRWRLVNRVVDHGQVHLHPEEMDEMLKEQLRYVMLQNLPLKVPEIICKMLGPAITRIQGVWQERVLAEFGVVEESAFPPCIQAIIGSLTHRGPLSHMGRFAITSFLHNIGMENTRVIELFGHVPNFDLRKTMYQVDHISGQSGRGTEYVSPLCVTMRSHSLCVHPDSLCKKTTHPLNYYKKKNRDIKRQKKGGDMPSKGEKEGEESSVSSGVDILDQVPATTDDRYKDK